ncbi:MAG: PleD family two-component system response regulator [Hyphomicrobiales bacterium]
MTARVLVVDDIAANVKLLEAKLRAEYFEVFTAMNGLDALESVDQYTPDIILLDVMMPEMDGIEVCKRIKASSQTQHIPIVMVTALDTPEDRVRGLEAGADDFLTKPVNDLALFCRVRSLLRLKMITDELRTRGSANTGPGEIDPLTSDKLDYPGKILLVDDSEEIHQTLMLNALDGLHDVVIAREPQQALFEAAENPYDLIIVSLNLASFDGLRLCSQIRSLERTRQIPLLILVHEQQNEQLMRALDMGVNDYLVCPVDRNELVARVKSQIRRWRHTQQLRHSVRQSIELAVTDSLTGLHNRRYMEAHLATLVQAAGNRGKSLTLLALDIDHFKQINDTYGHDAGDAVLREFARRIKNVVRGDDLACRTGGEEFIIVLPETSLPAACGIAERLRKSISEQPFDIELAEGALSLTVSIGLSSLDSDTESPGALLKRADIALYEAKRSGRNRVVAAAA